MAELQETKLFFGRFFSWGMDSQALFSQGLRLVLLLLLMVSHQLPGEAVPRGDCAADCDCAAGGGSDLKNGAGSSSWKSCHPHYFCPNGVAFRESQRFRGSTQAGGKSQGFSALKKQLTFVEEWRFAQRRVVLGRPVPKMSRSRERVFPGGVSGTSSSEATFSAGVASGSVLSGTVSLGITQPRPKSKAEPRATVVQKSIVRGKVGALSFPGIESDLLSSREIYEAATRAGLLGQTTGWHRAAQPGFFEIPCIVTRA